MGKRGFGEVLVSRRRDQQWVKVRYATLLEHGRPGKMEARRGGQEKTISR